MSTNATTATTFRLRGEQTVRTIAETHSALAEAFAQSHAVTIDAHEMTEADLTVVQLIESARCSAAKAGKTICMASPPPEALRDVLVRGGYLNAPDSALFWTAP